MGIVGCGVAGQAAALALARQGHAVEVFERFDRPQPLGAGLLLQPSGQSVLARLGLLDQARACGASVARLFGRTVRGRTVMDLKYRDLGREAAGLGIHRAFLFSILHEAMLRAGAIVTTGLEVASVRDESAPKIVAADGREAGPFDLVLDCSGAHRGILRSMGMAGTKSNLYAWSALWSTCADRHGISGDTLLQVYDRASLMIGILPVGQSPGANSADRHVALFWSLKHADYDALRAAGIAALKARVLAAWPAIAPIVGEIGNFDSLSLATYRDVRMRTPFRGRVLALGDAAHGTSPQLGQGANLALIDAITLEHALEREASVDAALALYARLRRAHLAYYQAASRMLTPLFQSDGRVLPYLRDLAFGPLGRAPVARHVMRTTLAGVRLWPCGIWKLPASGRTS